MPDFAPLYELSKQQTAGYLQHGFRCRLPLARHMALSSCKCRDMEGSATDAERYIEAQTIGSGYVRCNGRLSDTTAA